MINNLEIVETALLRGRVKLLQPKEGFRASIDSVFLAAAVNVKSGDKILDIGCGVGSVGLCIALRKEDIRLVGLDIQPELIEIANKNAKLNNLEDRVEFFCGNLKEEKLIKNNDFNQVLMNPPYMKSGSHMASPNKIKATSHGEECSGATLENWIKYAHHKLKQGGYLTIIHRIDRMDNIISSLTKRRWFGSLIIFPLWSHKGEDAKRFIIKARKERYAPLSLKQGIIIHKENGDYTDAAEEILSNAVTIDLT